MSIPSHGNKFDQYLTRLAELDLEATGAATLVSTLTNLEGEEIFEAAYLSQGQEVVQERISDDECILVKGPKVQSSASIILRGVNDYVLNEMGRSIHDSLCDVKRPLENGAVVRVVVL
ncbi:T-complex protein 1 subunit alpha [Rhizophlyctis rosea]|uniref:T-complex protein 1 subunit alpha n=1 Tax=Rhizophlyctis rosea TaxID=64517 RepID=A0AAD5S964_9FUNG|nr:T-complex protein 1 subunit alpha [Rhizophlyctis rosea]